MILTAFTRRVTPLWRAIRYVAEWEIARTGLTPARYLRLQAARPIRFWVTPDTLPLSATPHKREISRAWTFTNKHCDRVVGDAREVILTLDWTDPNTKDGQFPTLSLNLRGHGRALPLLWKTVRKTDLKGRMREYEEALCAQAAALGALQK